MTTIANNNEHTDTQTEAAHLKFKFHRTLDKSFVFD